MPATTWNGYLNNLFQEDEEEDLSLNSQANNATSYAGVFS